MSLIVRSGLFGELLHCQGGYQHDIRDVKFNNGLQPYGGTYPHRSNVAGFGDCLENGRLTQVIFFNEVE